MTGYVTRSNGAGTVLPDEGKTVRRRFGVYDAVIAALLVVLIVGLCLLAYPTVSDWWNRWHQSAAVAGYVGRSDSLAAAQHKQAIDQARAYNAWLATTPDRWHPSAEDTRRYDSMLNVTGDGVMAYLSIPKIHVQLPIYHGTDQSVLQVGVGHLEGTSLPVGGPTTHVAVSGHTGLPSATLLSNLDQLRTGDTFAFHVLGETYTYQVDQIDVVLPDDLSKLALDHGKDEATLITCTPYGVNTHRLLVRGHRIANRPDHTAYDTPNAMLARLCGLGAGVGTLAVGWLVLLIAGWRWRRRVGPIPVRHRGVMRR